MTAITENIESSQYAKLLKEECVKSIPIRKTKEILLLISFLIIFTIIVVYLWIGGLVYDFWFYILIGIVGLIVLAGYLMDWRYRPDWENYLLKILKEMKGVDTVKLSDYINQGQPFFGANLGNCEKFLKIAGRFIRNEVIEIVIQGASIYLKGFEPPPEEKEEKDSDEENA
ncbi:MAG: hypothetical protein HWN66_17635 [Candidatus Helarchaeota archaeon]|nr:hypothetical protein [Candidatus Helarchaeota archaeon]